MAVTATPIFVQTVRHAVATILTANTNRDGSGTIGIILTAGSNGSMVDHIDINATGSTTAGVVRLFVHNGTTSFLWKEVLVTANTPSTTVAVFSSSIDCSLPSGGLYLPTGYSLRASTHNAESINIHAHGGDL